MLSLTAALKAGKLEDFIRQQEADGKGPIDRADYDRLAEKVIKHETQSDQTSHSASRDGSNGKQTR
jgi:hypothetical protein